MDRPRAQLRASAMTRRREPPDVGAEAALLGAVLLAPSNLDGVMVRALAPEDFHRPDHGHAFGAMLALARRGEPLDVVTLAAELDHGGIVDDPKALRVRPCSAPSSPVSA